MTKKLCCRCAGIYRSAHFELTDTGSSENGVCDGCGRKLNLIVYDMDFPKRKEANK